MEGTIATEDMFGYTACAPQTVATIQSLATLEPTTLATMHGPAHNGPGAIWLGELAEFYRARTAAAA